MTIINRKCARYALQSVQRLFPLLSLETSVINTLEKAFSNYSFKDDKFSICMYVCICTGACVYQVPAEAEEGFRSLGTGVIDN